MESLKSLLSIRPALKVVVLFIAGLVIGHFFDASPSVLLLTLFVLSIAAILSLCVKVSALNFVFILAIIVAGFLRLELATRLFPSHHISRFMDSTNALTVSGKVVGFPHRKKDRVEFELKTSELTNRKTRIPTTGKILVRLWRLNITAGYGDNLQITGKIKLPRGERNPGEFNYQKFLAANGIYGIVDVSKPENLAVRPSCKPPPPYFIFAIKRKFYQTLNDLYPGQAGALIKALLLGERGEIPYQLREAFAECGVIHALAISGLHIGYIGIIFFVLFSLLRFGYQARIIAVIISVFCYALVIGFEPPIVRASLMLGIFLIGKLLQRQTDMLNVISTAALIILLINPLELFQPSFQLSFAAIISIFYLYQRLKTIFEKWSLFDKFARHKCGEYLGTLFLVTLAAQLGTLPIVAYYFGRIPLIAFLLNLFVIPLVGIIIALGFATLLFSLVSVSLAGLYANTNILCLDFLIRVIERVGQFRFAAIEISKIGLMVIAIYYFLLWLILNLNKKAYRKILAYSILLGIILILWQSVFQNRQWMQVIFFDVGQGDAALITFPDGQNLLIDAGEKYENFDSGRYTILPYLRRERIHRLNAVVLSHADDDHIGGMPSIFRGIPVTKIYDSGLFHESEICSSYHAVIDSLKTPRQEISAGERLPEFDNYGVFVLHPGKSFKKNFKHDINNCSVVVKIIYGERSFLFPGDIESEAEAVLINYGSLLKADVLKTPHHGSRTSTTLKWLNCVRPEYAVISVGRNNRFNLPAPSVLRRLQQNGIKILRTDLTGAVIFRTDGKRLERIR